MGKKSIDRDDDAGDGFDLYDWEKFLSQNDFPAFSSKYKMHSDVFYINLHNWNNLKEIQILHFFRICLHQQDILFCFSKKLNEILFCNLDFYCSLLI